MPPRTTNAALTLSLLLAVFLWGGTNVGTKFVVARWPPIWTGSSRFVCAGLLLLAILRFTNWLGISHPLTSAMRRELWWRGGLTLATYIISFNWALRQTSASHVALYLGAAPVWALLWEGQRSLTRDTVQRYGAAVLALSGIFVLNARALTLGRGNWVGEALGLAASLLWTLYSRQCRILGRDLSGSEVSAHTMWRAGVWLSPLALFELFSKGLVWRTDVVCVQMYCTIVGGVITFALWNRAMRYWPASQALLFNNLIPLSTMSWAHFCLGEAVTPNFWVAMLLVAAGVLLGQLVKPASPSG